MTTILLCWYALGWAACGLEAWCNDELTIQDVLLSFLFKFFMVPVFLLAIPVYLLLEYATSRHVLWKRK